MSNFEHWIKKDTEFEKAFLKIYDGNLWDALEKTKDWQPPKPLVEVPQCVADWFDINQDDIDGNIKALTRNIDRKLKSEWSEMDGWFMYSPNKSIETLIRMKLEGYTVEKEQLYEVIINGLYLTKLMKCDDSKSHRFIEKDNLVNWQETGYRLTAKQIKMIDDRYMAFAVKVNEVNP